MTEPINPVPPPRWFYLREDLKRRGIKLSDSSLSRKEAKGEFPKRVKLGRYTCAWVASEIDAYVEALMAARGEGR